MNLFMGNNYFKSKQVIISDLCLSHPLKTKTFKPKMKETFSSFGFFPSFTGIHM